jgi:hypothetical protein
MSARKCAFCMKAPPEVKISRSHVIKKEFIQHLTPVLKDSFTTFDAVVIDSVTRETKRKNWRAKALSIYDVAVKDVCLVCNKGWILEDVEKPIFDVLLAVALGRPVCVPRDSARRMALWASVTALQRALTEQGERTIPADHYRWIMERLEPPPLTYVAIARSSRTSHAQRLYRFGEMRDDEIIYGYQATFLMGELAVFVVGFAGESRYVTIDDIRNLIGPSAIQLWPDPHAFIWPLENTIKPEYSLYELGRIVSDTIERRTPKPKLLASITVCMGSGQPPEGSNS